MNVEKEGNSPFLVASQPLTDGFNNFKTINITSEEFTLGRGKHNTIVIPYLSISRTHCKIKKVNSEWVLEDSSTFGIDVNGIKVGKGLHTNLNDGDTIKLEPMGEFVYKFVIPSCNDDFEIPRKRMKIEKNEIYDTNIINDVKVKFEQSQNYERSHIEKKIESTKQIVTTSMMLKQQLQTNMDKKVLELQNHYAIQIANLQGEKNEVEKQTDMLIKERDAQLNVIQEEMGGKIVELMEQIKQHNDNEKQLFEENILLKEKLENERETFLAELLKESSSKQDMLNQLEKKMKEQELIRQKEREDLKDMHKKENEQLRLAKEKELNELKKQKKQRETELKEQLKVIKKNLKKQVEQTEEQRLKTEQELKGRLRKLQHTSSMEKAKMEQLEQEREELKKKFTEAQSTAEKSLEELREHVRNRETELAALAAERIQKQADQSSEVILNLQQQLETVQNKLQKLEAEKNTNVDQCSVPNPGEGTSSKQTTLTEFGELLESELQCSICAELFVEAMTLNCSHTFCKYCITRWKSRKRECPICREYIITECRSLVLDSFIDKMVENLSEDMKRKREEMLTCRKEMSNRSSADQNRTGNRYDYFDEEESSDEEIEGNRGEGSDYQNFANLWDEDDSTTSYHGDRFDNVDSELVGEPNYGSSEDDEPAAFTFGTHPTIAGIAAAYSYGWCDGCGASGRCAPGCPLS